MSCLLQPAPEVILELRAENRIYYLARWDREKRKGKGESVLEKWEH